MSQKTADVKAMLDWLATCPLITTLNNGDAPYAAWLSDVLATLEEHKVTKIAVAAPLPGGEVFTGYFAMGTMDKALMATNIQADATMDAICANGPLIQQAWEDAEENEDDPEEEV